MLYLCNGFSNTMVVDPRIKRIDEPITESEFIEIVHNCEFKSAIGHEQLANALTKLTGKSIQRNRCNLNCTYEDVLLMVSLQGRLPENPTFVQYRGRLNYSVVRFEKQTLMDIENSLRVVEKIKIGEL